MEIKAAQSKVAKFAAERGWEINTPSQRGMHLVREMGKLGEHLLFKEGVTTKDPGSGLEKQVGDVMFSLLQLANTLNLDVEEQLVRAMELDAKKYPAAATRAASLRAYATKSLPLLEKAAKVGSK